MKKILKVILWVFIALLIIGALFAGGITFEGRQMYKQAIEKISLQDKVVTVRANTSYLTLDQIPKEFQDAIIAVEDHRFRTHGGIDIISTGRAVVTNVLSLSIEEGGSTITQQLSKNLYFTQEQRFTRKVAELFVAFDFEKEFSKDDILELYINTIYFGDGYYGIKDACNGYFGKEPLQMTLDEITLLAGIPNAPSIYSLTNSPELARQRQKQVLYAMLEYNYLDTETVNALISNIEY